MSNENVHSMLMTRLNKEVKIGKGKKLFKEWDRS